MSSDPCACGCCASPAPPVPATVYNDPGLPSVSYRIGTYPSFREALIEALASKSELRELTTRDPSDYAIATLDSWAYIADVLTFYSERTINEAFLRTAKLRDSVVRLSAMVGYDPSPGLAATAPLAFTAQAPTPFTLPAGARVQSAPAPGDPNPPVKFETLADVVLAAALSSVAITGAPQPANPQGSGSFGGSLGPEQVLPAGVKDGATLVAWNQATSAVQRVRCSGVLDYRAAPPAGMVFWTPALEWAADGIGPLRRTMRLFGWDAPVFGIAPSGLGKDSQQNTTVTLTPIPSVYTFTSTNTIQLDALYAEISAGDQVLVIDSTSDQLLLATTVASAVGANTTFIGPKQGFVTQLTLNDPVPANSVQKVEVLLLGDLLPLWNLQLLAVINAGDQTVCADLDPGQAPLPGQAIVLGDATGAAYEATVVSAIASPDLPAVTEVQFSPALGGQLDVRSAVLQGNVVHSSQGQTVSGELLGKGDATIAGQRFQLGKPPITYVPHPGSPHGGQTTLVVRVGGVQWQELPYLYGAAPDDRVFVVERDDSGNYFVRFGDGVLGALVPTGAEVTADYRTGLGTAGNVAAGALHLPLTRPTGLVAVINPVAAGGGADPETIDEARANAPNTVRTFERIVSLQDFEDQARENAMVAKAHAAWVLTSGGDLGVQLTVAGPGGELLGTDQLAQLQADLDARRDPDRPLEIVGYDPIALALTVRLLAIESDLRPDDVQAAVEAALLGHFSFAVRSFGQTVRLSEAFVVAQNTAGVIGADVDQLTLADPTQLAPHQLSTDPIQDRIDLAPMELATLAAIDLTVSIP
jgi:predicted phage baseplate assembly protein